MWTIINMKVYLDVIRILTRSQKIDVSEISEVSL